MLGKYPSNLSGVTETLATVDLMATDYKKMSPKLNFLLDYWPLTIFGLAVTVAIGAFGGAYVVDLKRKKR